MGEKESFDQERNGFVREREEGSRKL